jgi:hypothetical protein
MSGKYDFTVTHEVIEMMEAESKVIVKWSCCFHRFNIINFLRCEIAKQKEQI